MPKTESAGRKLRRLRDSLGLTMHDIYAASKVVSAASSAEVPALAQSDIERGETVPNIYRMCDAGFCVRCAYAEAADALRRVGALECR